MAGLYGSRWQRARRIYLAEHPLCIYCERAGRVTVATVVDHRVPHKGDEALFWDADNWQPLCTPCHDGEKRAEERGTIARSGCDANGWPLSPSHPWNQPAK